MNDKIRRIIPGVIYGPVKSRRFGNSLGINISGPGKYCSFNCVYCFRGFNQGNPEKNIVNFYNEDQVIKEFNDYIKYNTLNYVDDFTIAGNGEPTDNNQLPEIIDYLYDFRNRLFPQIKISLLTNGMGFIRRVNPAADFLISKMNKLDQLCVKLDSGNTETWRKIANPCFKLEFEEWFDDILRIKNPVIQTMLISGRIDNTTDKELDSLIDSYKKINPAIIHIITINKPPADSRLLPVPGQRLNTIKEYIQMELNGIKVI